MNTQSQQPISNPNFLVVSGFHVRTETQQMFITAVAGTVKAQDTFVEGYRMALEDVAGLNWRNVSPKEIIFRNAQIVAQGICLEKGMELSTFRNYCNAARKCVMFNVPFSLARNLKISDLEKAQALADELDATKPEYNTPAKRMAAVFTAMKKKKHEKAVLQSQSALFFPMAHDTTQTLAKKLSDTVSGYLGSTFLQPFVKDKSPAGKFLRDILDLCQKYDKQEKLKAAKTSKQVM